LFPDELHSMDIKSQPFLRAIRLLWNRMGLGRIYVVAAAALLFVLAAIGLSHLVSSRSVSTSKQSSTASRQKTAADSSVTSSVPREPVIAITEVGSTEKRERNGQSTVAVRIGVAPGPNTKKGEVEIRVLFFDTTRAGEMRPTDAQVDYQWMTAVRDWSDPTPKYLVATYHGAGTSRQSAENLHYGGFLVRVYFNGQLQAEQSEPKALVTALRNQGPPPPTSPVSTPVSSANLAVATPTPLQRQANTVTRDAAENRTAVNKLIPSPSSVQANRNNFSPVPYASPVPDKPGFVYSPHNPKFLIDVRGFPPGTEVKDPNTGELLKVP
jgi:hypothetical protein